MQTSLTKLMSVPTVDTSYHMPVDELHAKPLISVCPKLYPDLREFWEMDYKDDNNFFSGMKGKKKTILSKSIWDLILYLAKRLNSKEL